MPKSSASSSLITALHSDGPARDRANRMGLYAFLIGDWTMEAVIHQEDGGRSTGNGRIHAGWVLEGRAIQDVWILPNVFYGSTLRIYDPERDAWHILWSDPLRQFYRRQIGRARGRDIVQDGEDEAGLPVRWSFTEMTPDSFHWLGERVNTPGGPWWLEVEMFARRARNSE